MTSYQKDVYDLLPTEFSRKQVLQLATDLNLYGTTAASYLHCWVKRKLISQTDRGLYRKNSETFYPGKSKEFETLMAMPSETQTSKPVEQDAVLQDFSIKSATDDELLVELVARGYKWAMMFKTTVTEVKYDDYKIN